MLPCTAAPSQNQSMVVSLNQLDTFLSHLFSLTLTHFHTHNFLLPLLHTLFVSLSHTHSLSHTLSVSIYPFSFSSSIYLMNVYLYPLQKFDELIPDSYRIVNNKDIVPRIPRSSKTNRFLQYEHVGRTVMINGGDFETTEPSIGTAPIAVWVQGENDGMERQGMS